MSDAYQRPAIVAYLHSREQHPFHRFQQSTTFHSDSSDRDSQTVAELPGKYVIIQQTILCRLLFPLALLARSCFLGKFKRC